MKDNRVKNLIKETIKEFIGDEKPRFKARLAPEPPARPKNIGRQTIGTKSASSYMGGGPPSKRKANSVWDIVDYLKDYPGSTENEINKGAFGFNRHSGYANKKYADLLRRALAKGLIQRAEKTQGPGKSKFVYFLPGGTK
jgi:hypothetical protein